MEETCGRGEFYLTSEILGLLGGRCDRGRPGEERKVRQRSSFWGKRGQLFALPLRPHRLRHHSLD